MLHKQNNRQNATKKEIIQNLHRRKEKIMNIFVTGGAGYIGSICVEELIKQNHSVVVSDNLQEGHRKAVLPEAVFYEGDFGDKRLLKNIFQTHNIDAVIHFAAETTIEHSMTDPQKYFINNVVNGVNLLQVMKEHGCMKFIFSSTAATFGEPEYTPIDEKHNQKPINAYGESKLMFEKILDWYHFAYGLKFNAFRYFNAAGASKRLGEDHKHESHLIPIVLKTALDIQNNKSNKGLKVFGKDYATKDGTCIRDYIHVVDLARAHILALDNLDSCPNAKYNMGNGKGFSVLEVIDMAKKITGIDIPYEFADRRPGDPEILVASSDKVRNDMRWEAEHTDLEHIVRTAWEWHSSHPEGYGSKQQSCPA
jgi:UDP-glucose 4-epimerase